MEKLKFFLLLGIMLPILSFELPEGWIIAGTDPKSYEMGIAKGAGQDGKNAATIQSIDTKIAGFGTLMQNISAQNYLGKSIRLSGFMKSKDVNDWAGFWLRVDQANSQQPLSFDNMQDRAIKGTSDWMKCEIVLDVPLNASAIAFGALVSGTGQIWFDNLSIEIVNDSVPTTKMDINIPILEKEPVNLNFDE